MNVVSYQLPVFFVDRQHAAQMAMLLAEGSLRVGPAGDFRCQSFIGSDQLGRLPVHLPLKPVVRVLYGILGFLMDLLDGAEQRPGGGDPRQHRSGVEQADHFAPKLATVGHVEAEQAQTPAASRRMAMADMPAAIATQAQLFPVTPISRTASHAASICSVNETESTKSRAKYM